MSQLTAPEKQAIRDQISKAVAEAKITDIHTHLYDPAFGDLLLWGIDDLLAYHYLVAETMRWTDMPYSQFYALPKREQADIVWQTLFVEHVPFSESTRGLLTSLQKVGLDTSSRNLEDYRAYFASRKVEDYIDQVFELSGVESVVMTNDPFDELERGTWMAEPKRDPRFHAALRLDALLNGWHTAVPKLREWGYDVEETVHGKTIAEVQRFLRSWIDKLGALYMAVSLPPTFAFPTNTPQGRLIEHCVLPVAHDKDIPFAMMIGVKKLANPGLKLAGDSAGKGDIDVVEYLCANYPDNKFLVTMLVRENQHELCVAARKFRNLLVFGCWWFLNNPIFIKEMTQMRLQMLGASVIPQHSDSRVLDQVIYKWEHAKSIIADVLADQCIMLAETGWKFSDEEIRRDIAALFGGNFWTFLGK
jgi:hypothetical protein